MVDRPPPSRLSVVERGGRLVVIDKETGQTPLSAAERMAEHDRRMGNEPMRAAPRQAPVEPPAPAKTAAPRAEAPRANDRMSTAVAQLNNKRPWKEAKAPAASAQRTPIPQRSPAQAGGGVRKTVVTGKWWDAKGPRTIELGPRGQQKLSGGFLTLFFVTMIAAIIALIVQPVVLFIGAFLLFRFGGKILGPIGAAIVDKALAEKG